MPRWLAYGWSPILDPGHLKGSGKGTGTKPSYYLDTAVGDLSEPQGSPAPNPTHAPKKPPNHPSISSLVGTTLFISLKSKAQGTAGGILLSSEPNSELLLCPPPQVLPGCNGGAGALRALYQQKGEYCSQVFGRLPLSKYLHSR